MQFHFIKSEIMNKLIIGIIFSLMSWIAATAQTPGGVENPICWLTSVFGSQDDVHWKNHMEQRSIFSLCSDNTQLLNFNPAFSICEENSIVLPKFVQRPRTIIAVAQTFNAEEQIIWSMVDEKNAQYVLTNQRLADLNTYSYVNYEDRQADQAFLSTYIGQASLKNEDAVGAIVELTGQSNQELPATNFNGLIPEILMYDRVLTYEERNKVESMLAIKYGLNISSFQSPHYISSANEVIWDGVVDSEYSNHIAGIGRDDASGLYQKQASSVVEKNVLTISAGTLKSTNQLNDSEFSDLSFLMWGDNDKPLETTAEHQSVLPLTREWKIVNSNFNPSQSTNLYFDLKQADIYLAENEIFWLAIDRSGTGQYSPSTTEYFKIENKNQKGVVKNIFWDTDESGSDQFRIQIAPKFYATVEVEERACNDLRNAQLSIQPIGGQAPFNISLSNKNGDVISWAAKDNQLQLKENVPPGIYELEIKDAKGISYQELVVVAQKVVAEFELPREFTIPENGEFILDISDFDVTEYHWIIPDGSVLTNETLRTDVAGEYMLLARQNGCISKHYISLFANEATPLISFHAFPNPTLDGKFVAIITCRDRIDLELNLIGLDGRLVASEKLQGRSQYYFQGNIIGAKGQYILTVKSNDQTSSISILYQ